MEKYIEQNGITYELRGEQYYPCLNSPNKRKSENGACYAWDISNDLR